jgi:hypothetical protein
VPEERARCYLGVRGRRTHRMTTAEIAESDRLRWAVATAGLSDADLARAAGCTRSTIRAWIDRHRHLAPSLQVGIRTTYSSETGGP